MTNKDTILITDDDSSLLTVLSALLQEEGFNVIQATRGAECLRKAYDTHPDLVLLDIMLPDKQGTEVCRQLREISSVPIVMLTADSTGRQKVDSLTDGADDYVTKPFDNNELVARIRALLRRNRITMASAKHPAYDDGLLRIDFDSHSVRVNASPVLLSPKEWRLLECLIRHKGRVATRETLLRYVWGDGYEHEINYLKVYVSHLRRKLDEPPNRPRYIHTERDLGYRFEGRA